MQERRNLPIILIALRHMPHWGCGHGSRMIIWSEIRLIISDLTAFKRPNWVVTLFHLNHVSERIRKYTAAINRSCWFGLLTQGMTVRCYCRQQQACPAYRFQAVRRCRSNYRQKFPWTSSGLYGTIRKDYWVQRIQISPCDQRLHAPGRWLHQGWWNRWKVYLRGEI
jgi:hypothetical protein